MGSIFILSALVDNDDDEKTLMIDRLDELLSISKTILSFEY
jgi:hypothetical protein